MLAPYPGKNEPETLFFSLTEVSTREVATVIFYNTIMARLLSYAGRHKNCADNSGIQLAWRKME